MGVLLFSLVSCSSEAPTSDFTQQAYCQGLAVKYCSAAAVCCSSSGVEVPIPTCTDQLVADCLESFVRSADFRVYDGGAARECVELYPSGPEACRATSDTTTQACGRVWVGTSGEGETCESSNDCARAAGQVAVCTYAANADVGVCSTISAQSEQGECFSDADCQQGLFCDDLLLTCQRRRTIGQACSRPGECSSFGCQSGSCAESRFTAGACEELVGDL